MSTLARIGRGRTIETRTVALSGAVLLIAAAAGAGIARSPLPAIGAVAALVGLTAVLMLGERAGRLFLGLLVALLVGYLFLSKGLAYVGVRPLYVSEMVLAVAVVVLVTRLTRLRIGITEALLLGLMAWGAFRTIPYLSQYGLDALRDGVSWGYGVFALAIAATLRLQDVRTLVRTYGALIPVYLAWVPVLVLLNLRFLDSIPRVPGAPQIPILFLTLGHTGVHLGAIAAFILGGLYAARSHFRWVGDRLTWLLWFVAAAPIAALSRGALLAATTGGLAVLFATTAARWAKVASVVAGLAIALVLVNPTVDLGNARTVSVGQLVDNVASVFTSSDDFNLEASRQWRLTWWERIVDYTVGGPYIWTGKGYGINLALDDGIIQPDEVYPLRAPHNAHVEQLARAGLPGIVLWAAFNLAIAIRIVRASFAARRAGRSDWVALYGWLLVYLVAALVNMTFDVYLQGPHGGIWYWAVIGVALAATRFATGPWDQRPLLTEPAGEAGRSASEHAPGAIGARSG